MRSLSPSTRRMHIVKGPYIKQIIRTKNNAFEMLHRKARRAVGHIIGQVDEELRQAPLGGCVVAENGREGGIAEGFGKTLAQSLPGSAVIAQTGRVR